MKNLIVLLTVFTSLNAFSSYQIRSQLATIENNEIEKRLILTCSAEETICQQTCNIQKGCILKEVICEDCATQQSQLLHTVLTDVKSKFSTDAKFVNNDYVADFFKSKKFMTVSYDSFLNYFTPEKKEELKKTYESLCYATADGAMMLLTINDNNQLEDLVGTICHYSNGRSLVLPIELNSDFSNKSINYWDRLDPLKLRFDFELKAKE